MINHSDPLIKELTAAITLAKESGQIAQQIRAKGYKVKDKGGTLGPVTEADQAVSDYLLKKLTALFPQDGVVSEEASKPQGPSQAERVWFIDPIDGTREFINDKKEWSVMIGLAIHGTPHLGVVYQPDEKKIYYATKENGAYCHTAHELRSIQVRTITNTEEAILIQSRSHWSNSAEKLAGKLKISHILKLGSLGLKLGKIAEGEADLYINFSGCCHLWDVCGPEAILAEAGGIVSFDSGKKIKYCLGDTVVRERFFATTQPLYKKIHGAIKS